MRTSVEPMDFCDALEEESPEDGGSRLRGDPQKRCEFSFVNNSPQVADRFQTNPRQSRVGGRTPFKEGEACNVARSTVSGPNAVGSQSRQVHGLIFCLTIVLDVGRLEIACGYDFRSEAIRRFHGGSRIGFDTEVRKRVKSGPMPSELRAGPKCRRTKGRRLGITAMRRAAVLCCTEASLVYRVAGQVTVPPNGFRRSG